MGTYLLKIEPTTSKRSAEEDLPQQNVPKKKKIVKSSVEEGSNGNDRRILDSSKLRSCPYCDKEMKKSRLPHHINHQHDQTCPKCPTVVGLKANEFLRHWKSPEHYAKIGYNCKDCMFATQNLKKFRFHRLKCHGSQLKNCDHAKMLAKAEEFEQGETCYIYFLLLNYHPKRRRDFFDLVVFSIHRIFSRKFDPSKMHLFILLKI